MLFRSAADYSTTGSFAGLFLLSTTDPATGSAWVLSALDSLECGVVEKDGTNKTRWTSGCIMVDYTPASATTNFLTLMGVGT